jgi:hypothetical protein
VFCNADRIRLSELGSSLSKSYSARDRLFTAAVLLSGGRYGSLAGSAEGIGAVILFGDVSDDRTECDDNYVGQTDGDSHCVEDAMVNHYCCTEMDAADAFFH